jgi:hypothetical protein
MPMPTSILSIDNEHLHVDLFDDASANITDKARGGAWRVGSLALQDEGPIDVGHCWLRTERSLCETFPASFKGQVLGQGVRFRLFGRGDEPLGSFTTRWLLDGPDLVVHIDEVDESLPSLVYPPPIECESLLVPMNVGRWIRRPLSERKFWTFWSHLSMRFVAGLSGERGWMCIFEEGRHDAGAMVTRLSASPGWLKSMGRWTPRSMRYRFFDGGYVGAAKCYRRYAFERGIFVSLRDKLERQPEARAMVGGHVLSIMQARPESARFARERFDVPGDLTEPIEPRVAFSHRQTLDLIRKARAAGMRAGLVNVRGWISGGYDCSHPDPWPPEPALGSIEELRAICAQSDGLVVALHDNYQDIYRQSASWPRGIVRRADGARVAGGNWAGGQAYILNSADSLRAAQTHWPDIRSLGPRAMFIDTTTAVQLFESYEPGNTQTREQDELRKHELLRMYARDGCVVGSEEASDFALDVVTWLESRHHRTPGESVPLWPLVYHDAAFMTRYAVADTEHHPSTRSRMTRLCDELWGCMPLVGMHDVEQMPDEHTLAAAAWHGRVGLDEMRSHQFVAGDPQLERTEFEHGTVVVNFSGEPRRVDGRDVAPMSAITLD